MISLVDTFNLFGKNFLLRMFPFPGLQGTAHSRVEHADGRIKKKEMILIGSKEGARIISSLARLVIITASHVNIPWGASFTSMRTTRVDQETRLFL